MPVLVIENLEKQFKDNLNHYSGQNNTIFDSISRNLKSTSDNITDKGILNNPILNNSILNGGAIVSAGNLVLGSNSLLMTGELGDNENRI